ncbi:MAG TPA: enoyl-CoA hydratase-related protein [Acidimicrobiia bacterium]|nr:enoyl-CoA hydratase-related protein [Acidimicrobiia bacterium]
MLLVEDRDRVRLLTFNRPDRANAFDEQLYHASADALRAAASDDDVAVVVFTGAGKAFCAGTDLLEMAETVDAGVGGEAVSRNGFPAFVDVLQEFPKPLLAAVNGAAVGLGFTMLAHCDLVFVSDRARLLAPFTNMGVAPEAASSYLLPRRMGRQQASLSLFTSDWISAEEAVATGLAVRQCSPETLVDETMELATRIASKSLPSLMATKRLLLNAEREGIARARSLENAAFAELLALPNAKDGVLGQLD